MNTTAQMHLRKRNQNTYELLTGNANYNVNVSSVWQAL